jgi:hypothetical protein
MSDSPVHLGEEEEDLLQVSVQMNNEKTYSEL